MPSKTPKQARLMAAVAHGWKPDRFKGPSVKVAKEFNQADKGSGILARHAAGGMVRMKPPVLGAPPPVIGHQQSPLGQSPLGIAIQNKGNAGRYAGGMGLAPARPPRVSTPGMLRNIDQGLRHKQIQLKALGGSLEAQQPSQQPQMQDQPMDPHVKEVIMTALQHLQNMDASSAAAVLGSSPEAMSHPGVAAVAHALRTATGITPATKTLNQLSQAGSGSGGPPMQTLRPPAGAPPQMPGGGPPQAGAQPPEPEGSVPPNAAQPGGASQ